MMFIKRLLVLFVFLFLPSRNIRASFSSAFFSKKILPKRLSTKKVDKAVNKRKKHISKLKGKEKVSSFSLFDKFFWCALIFVFFHNYGSAIYCAFNHDEAFVKAKLFFDNSKKYGKTVKNISDVKNKNGKILPVFNQTLSFYDAACKRSLAYYSAYNFAFINYSLGYFGKFRVYINRGYYVAELNDYVRDKNHYLDYAKKQFDKYQQ